MPKEYKVTGSERTYTNRENAHKIAEMIGQDNYVEERDISDWRTSLPDSNVLVELRRLRGLTKQELENELHIELTCMDNPYEQDTAVLFHLIKFHGTKVVQNAVREMLGGTLPAKENETS